MYIKVGVIALGHFNTGTCSIRSGHFRIWQIWIKSQFPERVGTRSLQRARRLQWIRADWQLLCLATFAILIFILVILQTFHTFHQVPPGNRTLALTQHHPDLPRGADCWPSRAENDYCACCGRTGLLVCFNDLYAFVECVCVWLCVYVPNEWKQTVCLEAKKGLKAFRFKRNQLHYISLYTGIRLPVLKFLAVSENATVKLMFQVSLCKKLFSQRYILKFRCVRKFISHGLARLVWSEMIRSCTVWRVLSQGLHLMEGWHPRLRAETLLIVKPICRKDSVSIE